VQSLSYDLHLDMPRLDDVLFDVQRAVLESGFGFGTGGGKGAVQTDIVVRHAHSPPASAGGGLDDYGVPDLVCDLDGGILTGDLTVRAGNNGHTHPPGKLARGDLVTQKLHRLRRRSDEGDPAFAAYLGKVRVLGEETITRMDRLDIGYFGGTYDTGDIEIALGRTGRSDADRLIGKPDILGVLVGL